MALTLVSDPASALSSKHILANAALRIQFAQLESLQLARRGARQVGRVSWCKPRSDVRFAAHRGLKRGRVLRPRRADSVEKVPNLKSLQICQNTNDIFD
jgi:hypothetical protein